MSVNILYLSTCSIFISIIFIYLSDFYFKKNKLNDKVIDRSSHKVNATRSGGLGIFMSVFFLSLISYILSIELFDYSLLVPLSLLAFVGLYDDVYQLDFKLKFIFQIIAAKIIIDNGLIIDNLHGVLGIFELNRIIAQTLTIFIIVAIINSINFIDGIDGLAISVVILFILCFAFFINSGSPYLNLSIVLVSSLLPLYYFNFKKKDKVFLGDSGSLFLGGLVSIYVIYILTNDYIIKESFDLHKILFVTTILTYPIIDLTRIFFLRISRRKSPFEADKNHIHHIILKKVDNHFISTIIIIGLNLLFLILVQLAF